MDLADLLKGQEGKTLEFKRDLSSPGPVMKTVVAFANTAGGYLVVGVDDRTRDVTGVGDPLKEEERLANLIADRIAPPVVPDIEVAPWRSTNVLVARISDSPLRPHYVANEGSHYGVYVRVGSTSRRAGPELIEEMGRYVGGRTFDEEPYLEVGSEAIDFRAASESFGELRRLQRKDLKTLRIVTDYQGREVPTVGGFLLFGNERLSRFPDSWVRVGLFLGKDRSKILDSKEVTSSLPQMAEDAIEQIQRMTAAPVDIRGTRNVRSSQYPPVAIREAVVNAVVHADYSHRGTPLSISIFSDRLEVENPGLLPFGLTLDEIRGGASKLRNRVIGRVFRELGLIEQWGSGVQRMISACRDAGLPEPQLDERANGFRVVLRSEPIREARLEKLDERILKLLRARAADGVSTAELARQIERTDRATRTRLLHLLNLGLAVRVGKSRTDPKARWFPGQPGQPRSAAD